uniref:Uncharacterized protein n=1 Tax=Homalodisca liturata TaxID=320908 RepID=A0A1B6JJF6_9HEMI
MWRCNAVVTCAQQLLLMYVFILLVLFSCLSHSKELLTEPEDFKKLDAKITQFLRDPTKDGWEDNLKDIDFFLNSMKNMIMVLNGTLPGLTKGFLSKVRQFHDNDKPIFIDLDVVEYELQPRIKVSDEDFTRLCWLRIYSEKDWEYLCEIMKNKHKLESTI